MLEHPLEIGQAFIAKGMSNFRNTHICLFQIPSGSPDAVNIDIFTDSISGDFFKNATDVGFAQIKPAGQFIQRNWLFAVFCQKISNAVSSLILWIVRVMRQFLMLTADKFHQFEQPGKNVQINAGAVITIPGGEGITNVAEQTKDQSLLFLV